MTDTAFRARMQDAEVQIQRFNMPDLLGHHAQAIEEYMEVRRQHAEARRLLQDTADHVDEVKLDALLEMEQDPDYVPGKNAEQRKQQAEAFLAKHRGVAAAKNRERNLRLAADNFALTAEHAKMRVDHLELQVAARRTELDLIASFARGAQ